MSWLAAQKGPNTTDNGVTLTAMDDTPVDQADDVTAAADTGLDAEETVIVPDGALTEMAELAWSNEDSAVPDISPTESPKSVVVGQRSTRTPVWHRYPPRSLRPLVRWGVAITALLVTAAAVAWLGTDFYRDEESPSSATTVRSAPAAVLDGTYRVEFDDAKQTANGAPDPAPDTDNTVWWAFRSSCRPTGCVATGTELDINNHQVAFTPTHTAEFHFVDGHWRRTPVRTQEQYQQCLGADGKIVAGADTEMVTWSLKPQPDGTLRGVWADTVLTNECGNQGLVTQIPLVVTRTGDVPHSVTVADPATVTLPTTSTPTPVAGGPVLDGTYSLDFENTKQTADGSAVTDPTADETHWWAFRSLCTSAGCVAAGAQLADENHQEATGSADVLRFADGHWQDTPSIQSGNQCAGATNGKAETDTISRSLQPQPDGTLRGAVTVTARTNECANQGLVWRTPLAATRKGGVPPSVVIADPALFVALPVPAPLPPPPPMANVNPQTIAQFRSLVAKDGLRDYSSDKDLASGVQEICRDAAAGNLRAPTYYYSPDGNPPPGWAETMLRDSIQAFCPQYGS